ncbi:MAG: hypothetical protein B7X49_15855 [Acidiphilium sp. 34-64-41]|nr:MAG: hypothetical protein B7X49_15855 [Acidiphilium sp. 34-64-41]
MRSGIRRASRSLGFEVMSVAARYNPTFMDRVLSKSPARSRMFNAVVMCKLAGGAGLARRDVIDRGGTFVMKS